jgi:hypothetical protein
METSDNMAERLELASEHEGYNTPAVDDIDWRVFQINCLGQWHFMNHHLRILNCCHGPAASHFGHPVVLYSLSLAEIPSVTCTVDKGDGTVL